MNPIKIDFDIAPVAKQRPRVFKFSTVTPRKTAQFEKAIKAEAMKHQQFKIESGPVEVVLYFYLKPPAKMSKSDREERRGRPSVRPDLDNYVKSVLDACDGVLWKDDGQVTDLFARKEYRDRPGISMRVMSI
jgi:Holliday junction resolvase RusA-like endonuclease